MAKNLTLTNAIFDANGEFSQALSGGYGLATNPLPTNGPFTIEAWVLSNGGTGFQVIAGSSGGAWIGQTADGHARGFYSDVAVDSNSIVINDGAWHHISFNADPQNGVANLFVDGSLAAANTTVRTIVANNQFGVRAYGDASPGGYMWTGEVDEVAIYSGIKRTGTFARPTTATSNTTPGLLALWHLNGDGTDATGLSPVTAPNAPTIGTPVAGDGYIDVYFTPAGAGGTPADFLATLSTGQNAAGTTSPIRVAATNGTATTATVTARNTASTATSGASTSVTPQAPAGAVQIAYNDGNLKYSPSGWDDRGTYKSSNTPGAYVKAAFSGTSITAKVDVSALVAAGQPAASYPIVRTIIDGVASVDTQLTSGMTTIVRNGLANGAHTFELHFLAADIGTGDRWGTPVNAVRLSGFALDVGASLTGPILRPKISMHYADSIGEGFLSLGTVNSGPLGNSALHTVHAHLAQAFDCEYGLIAFSGQGYQQAGNSGVPAWPNAYGLFSAGRSRLVAGKFSPAPDYIFVEHGANGSTNSGDVQGMIGNLRAAAPLAKIIMLVPRGGYARDAVTAGFNAAADANSLLIDLGAGYQAGISHYGDGPNMYSLDGLHPNALANARAATGYANKIRAALDGVAQPTLTARTVTLPLGTESTVPGDTVGVPLPNLTGIKVAAFDEATPDLRSAPRYRSSTQTTDAQGVLTFVMQSTLASGGTCGVSVQMPDGRNFDVTAMVV